MLRKTIFISLTILCILIFCFIAFAKSAEKVNSAIAYGNQTKEISIYNIDGERCAALKDFAVVLKNTDDKFSFEETDSNFIINKGKDYSESNEFLYFEDNSPGYVKKYKTFSTNSNNYDCYMYEIENEYFLKFDDLAKVIGIDIYFDKEKSITYVNRKPSVLSDFSTYKGSVKSLNKIFSSEHKDSIRELIKNKIIEKYGKNAVSKGIENKINSKALCSSAEVYNKEIKVKVLSKEVSLTYDEVSDFMNIENKNYAIISSFFGNNDDKEICLKNNEINSLTNLIIDNYEKNKVDAEEVSSDEISDVDLNNPVIAITFDDGPKKGTTDKILDVLEEYGAKATFFVVGNMAEQNSELLKRAYDLGCQIGNHSYSHPILTKLGVQKAMSDEITKTSDIVKNITGEPTNIGRPPYGSINHEIKEASKMEWFNWSIDTYDWKTRNADSVYNNVIKNVGDGDVILMHDLYTSTVDAVKRFVPKLVEKGYQFVTIDELVKIKGGAEKISGHIKK